MSFGAVRVFRSRMTFQGYRDDSVVVNLWFPPRPFDTARLVVLLGPFGASEVTLYPLALEVVRQGYPVLILPHRGVGLNAHLFADFGFSEITDLRSALDAYGKYFRIPKVNVGLFGGSLGAAIAVNVAVQDSRVKGLALEGLLYDLQEASERALSSKQLVTIRDQTPSHEMLDSLSPRNAISRLGDIPVLMFWGEKDVVVTSSERQELASLIRRQSRRVEMHEVPNGVHIMRFGFPLPRERAIQLNQDIATFLVSVLK